MNSNLIDGNFLVWFIEMNSLIADDLNIIQFCIMFTQSIIQDIFAVLPSFYFRIVLGTTLNCTVGKTSFRLTEGRLVSETGNSTGGVPERLGVWQSPWKGKKKGGELVIKGEGELYQLAVRMRERFPDLFKGEYHPDIYIMKSSQIPRASASAVAFGMGLFNGKGTLRTGQHRAFAVTSESRTSDLLLRFHDICQSFKNIKEYNTRKHWTYLLSHHRNVVGGAAQ
ncbi:multiple inositol polyphosphate phosphatase 1-like isoform X2 [Papaver somniferum]|uniref:multiple inositol polyphosphate phosphatase 1-like isoform X2 n=1 Tax=Papaver somniferum TaxID=3469 RepID=UPI000E6FC115|nr:multiple inositol polyphosphate phosphatase 1-like isoform X2 [Papaver somniferum]